MSKVPTYVFCEDVISIDEKLRIMLNSNFQFQDSFGTHPTSALMTGIPKYEPLPGHGAQADQFGSGIYSRHSVGSLPPTYLPPTTSYSSYHWTGRDIVGEPFPFQPTMESRVISTQNVNWPSWLPSSPQADLLRYQSYLSSIGNRTRYVKYVYVVQCIWTSSRC